MSLYVHKHLLVKESPISGLGVFAIGEIKAGEIIEECHHIPLTQQFNEIDKFLQTYVYSWPKGHGRHATVALGYGSIYNHSREPNVDWETDEENNLFIYKLIKDVKSGEELLINYGVEYEKRIKTV